MIMNMFDGNGIWWVLTVVFLAIAIGIPVWFRLSPLMTLVCCAIGAVGIMESLYKLK